MAQSGPAETPARPPDAVRHRDDSETEFSRILAFSDGVFAIAITLIVLALEVPPGVDDVLDALTDRTDEFFAYAISFAVLAKLWLAHHRFFSEVARFDGTLMALNLVYLFWVALVPFTSELLGNYSGDSAGVIVYAVSMIAVLATFLVQIRYAYAHDLMLPEARQWERRFTGLPNYFPVIVFGVSIPIALLSPAAATYTWLAIFLFAGRIGDTVERRLG